MENIKADDRNLEAIIALIAMTFILALMILPSYPTYAMKFLIGSLTALMIYQAMD